ncbi:General stress protein A [Aliiroseovarius sp. xm-m-379]|uniref:glycosyltransferase family 8 protein n=1 Tax=unclassified Aliiroseovarius TaxID=2623558 RepID=UPI00156A69EA|nr:MULTISPECIES: glycosyltransferase family 8 protein [unclassified Aliiroseovarius]NRP25142.1 General stress protein A [Aliiroseovarius sp. xm-m-379]NRP33941.1 General stress protein A [Aliiroseovarius sp. xm-a-104]NRQ21062.1 General stress protein A [Aliiroseovarius sp. xm-v-204]NRQ26434.1 General stress protein A [Aliiroseovarius sp. xm-g-7]
MLQIPHIFYAFDQGFRYCSVLSAFSVLRQRREKETRITLLTPEALPGVSEAVKTLNKCFKHAEVRNIVDPKMNFDIKAGNRLPPAAYGRILLPDHASDRVIYLDGDTLVIRDIGEIYKVDLDDALVAAVRDLAVEERMYRHRKGEKVKSRRLFEMNSEHPDLVDLETYFNSGVVVMDLPRIRSEGLIEQIFNIDRARIFKEKYRTNFDDQDWLNHCFKGRIHLLPQEWNVFPKNRQTAELPYPKQRQDDYAIARENAALIHYVTKKKPWQSWRLKVFGARRAYYKLYAQVMQEMEQELGPCVKDLLR